ncbi:MAG TPA: COX15/CtaA family protein [Pyrinomonadaceae bacterium]
MSHNRFARLAWAVVAVNLLVIVWGAYVRASFSGDGCGSHWPLCNGEVVPAVPAFKTFVEFTHRATSGVALLLVVWLAWRARKLFLRGHRVRRGAAAALFFIVVEALIGALLVKFGWVARDDSAARAVVMSIHLVNTFLLLAAAVLTAWWASGAPGMRLRGQGTVLPLFVVGLLGVLLVAVSGAVTALGDTLFPARTLSEGVRQDFSAGAHFLLRLRALHPALAVVVGCYVVMVASYAGTFLRPGERVKRHGGRLTAIFLAQIGVGVLNVYLLAPVWLQLVHLALADLFWIALVLTAASALADEQPSAAEAVETPALQPAAEV